ncbi:MAG: DUF4294 domain-containing protein [Saprospiraceae bacterium]|nr:DUF4294 domain-containing protein [Saprospiraceae bacterium]
MKINQIGILFFFSICFGGQLFSQEPAPGYVYRQADGRYLVSALIQPNGDTLLYVQLREFEVKAPKFFANAADYKRWELYRRLAPTVVPYAVRTVQLYRQIEVATRDMANRDRKKYIKQLENQMEDQLKKSLTNLTRTQGFLLIEMVEKELHTPFYDLVKDVKGSFSAFYWNEFGKMYNYQLKSGYERGKDPILDSVLDQHDLSYYMR